MVLRFAPWGNNPSFDWDEYNEGEFWAHGIRDFEIEQCFENDHVVAPHKKAMSEPEKYGDRYMVRGQTNGGRKLIVIVQYLGANFVRPITGWTE